MQIRAQFRASIARNHNALTYSIVCVCVRHTEQIRKPITRYKVAATFLVRVLYEARVLSSSCDAYCLQCEQDSMKVMMVRCTVIMNSGIAHVKPAVIQLCF